MSNTATISEEQARTSESLNAIDRCDHADCGARAVAVVTLTSGSQLIFCGHHTNDLRAELTKIEATIDEAVEVSQ